MKSAVRIFVTFLLAMTLVCCVQVEKGERGSQAWEGQEAAAAQKGPPDQNGDQSCRLSQTAVIHVSSQDQSRSNILLIERGGENIVPITEGPHKSFGPVLSWDGAKIAFYSDMEGSYDIYVASCDGSKISNITKNSDDQYVPQWSPDNQHLCYQSQESGNSDIYIIHETGHGKHQLTQNGGENYEPIWSPDGGKILYVSNKDTNFDIYAADLNRNTEQRLTDDGFLPQDLSFSPDGESVLYAAGNIDSTIFELYMLDPETLEVSQFTDFSSYTHMPLWAGDTIIFVSDMQAYKQIYSINRYGGGLKNLTPDPLDHELLGKCGQGSHIFYQKFGPEGDGWLVTFDLEKEVHTPILRGSEDFEKLRQTEHDPVKIFAFIDLHLLMAGQPFADQLVDYALEFSQSALVSFQLRYEEQQVQQTLWSEYGATTDLHVLIDAEDGRIASLAQETLDRKYKLACFEQVIVPVVDFAAYQRYSPYLSPEMNAYLDILAKESEKPSVMGQAIVIGLDAYAARMMDMVAFHQQYPGFARIYRIVHMLNDSLGIYLGGIDHTPVFDSGGKILPHRLQDFQHNIQEYSGTPFADKLEEYIHLLASENYKKTPKVQAYIEDIQLY